MTRDFPIIAVLRTRCGCQREMKLPRMENRVMVPMTTRPSFSVDVDYPPATLRDNVRVFEYKSRDLPYVYYEEV